MHNMILDREDLDFVEGFVKQAYQMGADEETASQLLAVAFPQWKMASSQADEGMVKVAGPFTKHLGSAFRHGGKAFTAGMGNMWRGGKSVAKNPYAWGAGALGGGGWWGYNKLQQVADNKANLIDMRGFAPVDTAGGGGASGGSSGSYGASDYSPHGSLLQSRLSDDDGAGAAVVTGGGSSAVPSGGARESLWDKKFREMQPGLTSARKRIDEVQAQLDNLAGQKSMTPVEMHQERVRLGGELSSAKKNYETLQNNRARIDESLQAQQQKLNQYAPTAQAKVNASLSRAMNQAETWAQRQQQAREASWFGPRWYYNARNFITGDTDEYGNKVNQNIHSLRAAQERLNSQNPNYYHNY